MVEREDTESPSPHAEDAHWTVVGDPQQPWVTRYHGGQEGRGSQEVKSPSVFWSPLCPHESPPSTGIAHGEPAGTGKKEEKELCWLGVCPLGVEEWETAWCSTIHSAWGSLLGPQA